MPFPIWHLDGRFWRAQMFAPGTLATLRELTNPAETPVPRQGLPEQLRRDNMQRRLRDHEKLFAFLPDRVRDVMNIISQELQVHAHISIHHGKTQVWNQGGVEPEGVEELTRRARLVKPDAVVWKGTTPPPRSSREFAFWELPLGLFNTFTFSWNRSQLNKRPSSTVFRRCRTLRRLGCCF